MSVKGWSVGRVENAVQLPSNVVFSGDRYEVTLFAGDAGANVLIEEKNTLDLLSGTWLSATWPTLKSEGTTVTRGDGELQDGLKRAIRELIGGEIASDLGCNRE